VFRAESPDLDAPGHFLEWLSHRRTLYATPVSGPYHDIGNHETLAAARAAFADRDPQA
jgi:NDP-sugar pyrophosphorylase family protein